MQGHESWMSLAKDDLNGARLLISNETHPYINLALYHAKQAAEKILKAFLHYHDRNLPRMHDLEYLLELCQMIDPSLDELMQDAELLNPHSVEGRYPDSNYMMPDLITAKLLVDKAARIVNMVELAINDNSIKQKH